MVKKLSGSDSLIYEILKRGFIETHINKKFKFNVANTDNIKADYREAIKKTIDIDKVDEADLLIGFEETPQVQATQGSGNVEKDQAPVDNSETKEEPKKEETPAEPKPEEKKPEEKPEEEKKEEKKVDEAEEEKKEEPQPEQAQDNQDNATTDNQATQEQPSGETNDGATVDEQKLKTKIIETVARCLYVQDQKEIQMFDVDYKGTKTFFMLLTLQK